MDYKIENLVISTKRNDWGWYTVSGFVNGNLCSVRFDTKPTSKKAKEALISYYNR